MNYSIYGKHKKKNTQGLKISILFTSNDLQTTINRYKHKYFELANVPEITIHEFRHSHVSLLINQYLKSGNTDMTRFFTLMSGRLGHTVDVMQRTYMHLFPQSQDSIVDILNNL